MVLPNIYFWFVAVQCLIYNITRYELRNVVASGYKRLSSYSLIPHLGPRLHCLSQRFAYPRACAPEPAAHPEPRDAPGLCIDRKLDAP